MNSFYKVTYIEGYGDPKISYGVVFGTEEEIMPKIMKYYGHDNVTEVTFWFGENWDSDVVELDDLKECPIFDSSKIL